jgi:RNA polymerase sigma-70 factor, ECF subfamily
MDGSSTRDLVRRIREGDEAAFAEFVATYQDTVRSFTAMWAPSRDEADDIAQEVFLAALRSLHTFDVNKDLKTWLLGIARNLTRNAWRRVSRSQKKGDGAALDEVLEQHALAVFQERSKSAEQRSDALRECMQSLPQNTKAIFTQYFVDEVSSAELAGVLKTTENTVRATISRIRKGLRECIERRLDLESAP